MKKSSVLFVICLNFISLNSYAGSYFCSLDSAQTFYGVRLDIDKKGKVENVSSGNGGYGMLDLACKSSTQTKISSCTRTYIRNENKVAVTHNVRIYLRQDLEISHIERDIKDPGGLEVKNELLSFCKKMN